MKNSLEKILWGVLLVVVGVALAGRALDLFEFNLFFPGWWTLFFIVPSAISLVSGKNIASSIGGLAIGILLLMVQSGAIDWQDFGKLLIALIFVVIGCSFLFPGDKSHKREDRNKHKWEDRNENKREDRNENKREDKNEHKQSNEYNNSYQEKAKDHTRNNQDGNQNNNEDRSSQNNRFRQYTGFFSSQKDQYVDEVFGGAVVNAILGGVELDLRNAIFLNDTIIDITCIMGGVDIFVPTNMKVVVNCTPIMGGVDCYVKNHNQQTQSPYTLFIKGSCLMGGVEIK